MNIYSFIYYLRSAESIFSYCMELSYSILLQVTNGALFIRVAIEGNIFEMSSHLDRRCAVQ